MPKVDIIIPAYNAASFLAAALDSVIHQTFMDWRIILIDDGSTDNTSSIAAAYAVRLGEKLLLVQQENRGLPAARNAAIAHSSAPLLALLDADDVWLPERLEESVRCHEARPTVGLSYGFISFIDPQGTITNTPNMDAQSVEGWIASAIYTRSVDLPCPTITFRRDCIEQVGVFDESLRATEDRDLWLRIAQQYEVARIPKVLALYRVSPGAMTRDTDRMFQAQMQFLEKHYGSSGCGSRARRKALGSLYRQKAETLGTQGNRSGALSSIAHAVLAYPADQRNLRTAVSLLFRRIR